jgi:hypothetical protein
MRRQLMCGLVAAVMTLSMAGIPTNAWALAAPGPGSLLWAAARAAGAPAGQTAAAGSISTVAGGVGGPARATTVYLGEPLAGPFGVAYSAGRVYSADRLSVRAVSMQTDWLTTSAGTNGDMPDGSGGSPLGDGGPATRASLTGAVGITVDHSGNLVFSDTGRVRVVAKNTGSFYGQAMTAGDIYTVAGGGTAGLGDGGPATAAQVAPWGVAVDRHGNLVIADGGDDRVRVAAVKTGRFYGQAMTAGNIYTVAGNGTDGFAGDGGPATQAELSAHGVAIDQHGNLVIADTFNQRVRVVAASTGTFYGQPMTAGNIYTVAGNGTAGFAGDGSSATQAELARPTAASVDAAGNLVIADTLNQRVRVVAAATGTFYRQAMTAGDIYTVAGGGTAGLGDGAPATSAVLMPEGVTFDGAGNLVIGDYEAAGGRIRVVAAATGTFYRQAMTAGDIYTVAGSGSRFSLGDGGPAAAAELLTPAGVAPGAAVRMAIAETDCRVRVVASQTGTFFGQPMTGGHIYTAAGTGYCGYSGDGGPATAAELNDPQGVAFDHAGNLLIADTQNSAVRVVAAKTGRFYGQAMTTGDIYSLPVSAQPCCPLWHPMGVAVDKAGNVLVADTGVNVVMVRAARTGTFYGQPMTAGHAYLVAGNGHGGDGSGDGGPATSAVLVSPQGVAIDHAANLVIADTTDNRIRVVAGSTGTFYGQAMAAGDIYTVAGNGALGYAGDGGPATAAELFRPDGVTVDGAGNLVIADTGNNRVRMVAAGAGVFYGQGTAPGDIYTIAGTGTGGFSGDGGPAATAQLSHPQSVTVNATGDLLIADTYTNRIRKVTG